MSLTALLLEHGVLLAAGTTGLLALGGLAAWRAAPLLRQRAGELSVAITLLWIGLAILPLPRLDWRDSSLADDPAATIGAADESPRLHPPARPEVTHAEPRAAVSAPWIALPAAPPQPPVSAAPRPTPPAPFPTARALVWTWQAGAILAVLWLIAGCARLRHVLRRTHDAPDWLTDEARALADSPRLRVRLSTVRCRPFCTGVLRPTLLLPEHLLQDDRRAVLNGVLRHEIAHVARRDALGQALFAAALPVLWFHPLFWWLRRRARLAAEWIADDLASRTTGRREYARQMIRLAEEEAAPAPSFAAAVFRSRSEFYRRIEMLLTRDEPLTHRCSRRTRAALGLGSTALLAVAAALFGATPAQAQQSEHHRQVAELQVQCDQLRAQVAELQALVERLRGSKEFRELGYPNANDSVARRAKGSGENHHGLLVYRVQAGDTLESMLKRHGLDGRFRDQVLRLNPEVNPDALAVGQEVILPPGAVQAGPFSTPPGNKEPRGNPLRDAEPQAGVLDPTLIDLLTRRVDLEGEMRLAEQEMARVRPLVEGNHVSSQELLSAGIRLENLQRKQDLLTQLINAQAAATQREIDHCGTELERAAVLHERGFVSDAEVQRIQMRMDLLQQRLGLLNSEPRTSRPR